MPYVTMPQSPRYQQLSLDDILDGHVEIKPLTTAYTSATRTAYRQYLNPDFLEKYNFSHMINELKIFNRKHANLFEKPRQELYRTFSIPKHSGGYRRIDAPNDELMIALRDLKELFEAYGPLHHTAAFAYIPKRCAVDSVRKHQQNQSHWFLKTDFSNFFGSTTMSFLLSQLSIIFPFSEIMKSPAGKSALEKAIELCFLNGGLPQGTPISPLLTNIMMIPIDHRLYNTLRSWHDQTFVYTRYADDILISSRRDFKPEQIVDYMNEVLREFSAPFSINQKKTRYGSRAGRNWNLGVMLNKDNQITIGHRKKQEFRATINSYVKWHKTGEGAAQWSLHEVQVMSGVLSYYKSIEPDYIQYVIDKYNKKNNVNVVNMIREDLR